MTAYLLLRRRDAAYHHSLINALGLELTKKNYDMVPKIVETELNIENFDDLNETYNSKSYRNYFKRDDKKRLKLREQIVEELLIKKRLKSDEKIKLTKGGAAPLTELQQNGEAIIIIGLPASGKSTIATTIADKHGAYILDSDYAKRKIPEFHDLQFGATLVHEESSNIILGENKRTGFKSLLEHIKEFEVNCVLPKIGSKVQSVLDLKDLLKINGYKSHLILIELDRVKSTKRALKRFIDTNRYVPLGLIFDGYTNNPSLAYYKLKSNYFKEFLSFGILSTDVDFGQPPKFIEGTKESPVNSYKTN